MALSIVGISPGLKVQAAHVQQFYNLLTGVMTDQPVTLKNSTRLGGNQAANSVPLRVDGVAAQTARMMEAYTLAGDTQPVFGVDKAGLVSWGPGGGSVTDVTLDRSAVGALRVTGSLRVTTTAGIGIAPVSQTGLTIIGSVSGAASQRGIQSIPTVSSGATGEAYGVEGSIVTPASVFTLPIAAGFHAVTPSKGATSVITSAMGMFIDSITSGNNNNYGIYIAPPSGGSSLNAAIVMDGGGLLRAISTATGAPFIDIRSTQAGEHAIYADASTSGNGLTISFYTQSVKRMTVGHNTMTWPSGTIFSWGTPRWAATTSATATAGGGAALPVTIRAYFQVVNDTTGETVKIPYYSN